MDNEPEFRKKLSEREITQLNEHELQKIDRVNDALARSEQAEANKESQMKLRVLFERAPEETLPFIVYCIWVAAAGLSSFFYLISKFEGMPLYILLLFLLVILVIPLFLLPKIHIKKFFSWISGVRKIKKR